MKPSIRVGLVEDHAEMRDQLTSMLEEADALECVGAYSTAEEALIELPKRQPTIVLVDIQLCGMNGIEFVTRLKCILPEVQVLMITTFDESELIFDALKAGANGYLLKRTAAESLLDAIREVQSGGSPMSPTIARKVVSYFQGRGGVSEELSQLSRREREVLAALAKGALYKQIAHDLGVSLDTVRQYVQSVYRKLHVHSRTDAVNKYFGRQ
ncbi:MAG TPA: response regulator transcription factor [Chthoniobacteraceae bacterium]|jgi:DNA-binding NarL/FixJ family response regulator